MIQKAIFMRRLCATALLTGALISCNKPAKQTSGNVPAATVQSTIDAIVYVNADTLLANYQFFKDIQKELEEQGKSLESQVSNRTSNFQKQVGTYQQNAATMTPSERQSTEQNLGKAQEELQAFQQKVSQDMMKAQEDANNELHTKIEVFLREYAALNDYKFVLTYSRNNNAVLFADSTLDDTEEVLNGLNYAYSKAKN